MMTTTRRKSRGRMKRKKKKRRIKKRRRGRVRVGGRKGDGRGEEWNIGLSLFGVGLAMLRRRWTGLGERGGGGKRRNNGKRKRRKRGGGGDWKIGPSLPDNPDCPPLMPQFKDCGRGKTMTYSFSQTLMVDEEHQPNVGVARQ